MRIVQLSDLHLTADGAPLYGSVDTDGALAMALARVRRLDPAPDLLLLSGDLANGGELSAYRRLREALADVGVPWVVMAGNHDDGAALRAVFPDQPWARADWCCQARELAPGLLLCLDTLVPGEEYGLVGERHLAWLEEAADSDRPAVLCLHHPPFPVGIPGMDAIGCRGTGALAAWLQRHPEVVAVLCGHVHRCIVTVFAGRPALVAPSPAHQIALQAGPLAYTLEPGGFLVHDWDAGAPLRSHYVPLAMAPVVPYTD